jgi:hypothetical protein
VPINRPSSAGFTQEAAAQATLRRTFNLTTDAKFYTDELPVVGLPRLVFWLYQVTLAAPAVVEPQFSVRMVTGATPVPEWLPLVPTYLLTPGTPVRVDFAMPCRAIRIAITRSPGVNTQIELVIAGAASS